jgi:hypothetical protein
MTEHIKWRDTAPAGKCLSVHLGLVWLTEGGPEHTTLCLFQNCATNKCGHSAVFVNQLAQVVYYAD